MNVSLVEPYLFFEGRCEEAIEFYKRALGAQVELLMRYKESPEPHQPQGQPPGSENKIMHASLKVGQSKVMVSDGRCTGRNHFDGFALSVSISTEAEAQQRFAALSQGGQILMPMGKTFFSPCFGMVNDTFGVMWMVIVQPERS